MAFYLHTKRIEKLDKKVCVLYNIIMIYKAVEISRNKQNKLNKPVRGYYTKGSFDYFDIYVQRYSSGVVSLKTALSIHGLIDDWNNEPFDFCFKDGYRKINDEKINQYRDNEKIFGLGVEIKKTNKIEYKIYNKERLLIELWRKEKYISKDIYKEAIYSYRKLASNGELNIPLLKEYIRLIPKSQVYSKRLSMEVL